MSAHNGLEQRIAALAPTLVRQRWLLVGAVLLFSSGLAATATSLRLDNSLAVWFVEDDPALVSYRELQERFGGDESVVTLVQLGAPGLALAPENLERLRALDAALAKLDGVEAVLSFASSPFVDPAGAALEASAVLAPGAPLDLERARRAAAAGALPSRLLAKERAGYVVTTWFSPRDDIDQARGALLARVDAAVGTVFDSEGVTVHHGGIGVVYEALNRAALEDGGRFIGLSYLFVILALWLVSGRLLFVAVGVLAVSLADLSLFGAMALLDRPLTVFTVSVPALVMILGVANVLHLASHLEGGRDLDELTKRLGRLLVPCLFNSVTTAVAFSSLLAASMAVTRDFGLFSAVGVLLSTSFALIFVAAALPRLAKRPRRPSARHRVADVVSALMRASARRPAAALVAFSVLAGGAGLLATRIEVDTSSLDLLPEGNVVRKDSAALEEGFGPYLPLELLLRLDDPATLKRAAFLQALADAAERLEGQEGFGVALSVVDLVSELKKGLTGSVALRRQPPMDDAEAAQLFELLALDGGETLDPFIDDGGRVVRLTVTIWMGSARVFGSAVDEATRTVTEALLARGVTGVEVARSGYLPLYERMLDQVVGDQVSSFLTAFGLVFALIFLVLRAGRLTILAVPVNLLPLLFVLGVMGASGVYLDIATVTIAATLLGIVVDDTVHLLYALKEPFRRRLPLEEALDEVARTSALGVVSTSAVLLCGFVTIGFATVRSVSLTGSLSAVTVLAALLCDLFLLPALAVLLWQRRR